MATSAPQLAPALDAIRLFLHVGAAAIFVGGQITMAGLMPTMRGLGGDAGKRLAAAFSRLAWPAFAVLVATGFWNVSAVGKGGSTWNMVLGIKMLVVVIAGVAAFLHQRASTKSQLALWGSIAGTASIVALFLGVLLAG